VRTAAEIAIISIVYSCKMKKNPTRIASATYKGAKHAIPFYFTLKLGYLQFLWDNFGVRKVYLVHLENIIIVFISKLFNTLTSAAETSKMAALYRMLNTT
jgi:hypothetical protein